MSQIRLLIVDDEPLARQRLRRMLQQYPEFTVVEEFSHGAALLTWLEKNTADIILLDIQMPGQTGLEVAELLQQHSQPPMVIFCTAYDEHAIAAFKVDAVDYLLKPVRQEELTKALKRAALKVIPVAAKRTHISANTHKGLERIAIEEVSACLAEQKYVKVIHQAGEFLIEESLKQLEEDFPDFLIRAHRSALVNKHQIVRLETQVNGGHQVCVKGVEEPISISRRQLAEIRQHLKSL